MYANVVFLLFYRNDGILTWRAYSVGEGSIHMQSTSSSVTSTELIVLQDFVIPVKGGGVINFPNQNCTTEDQNTSPSVSSVDHDDSTESTSFSCIEPGCRKVFQTFTGLESHILLGNHQCIKTTATTYDSIKHQWKNRCEQLSEQTVRSNPVNTDLEVDIKKMGWALKSSCKSCKHRYVKVKEYLTQIIEAGKVSGQKMLLYEI